LHIQKHRIKKHVWRALRLAGVKIDTPGANDVVNSICWLISQQAMVLNRFPIEQNDVHTREGFDADAYWPIKFTKFLHRADLLTLESPEGRQAVAEFCTTSVGLLASVWRLYGSPASNRVPIQTKTVVKVE
jgi:hypothetical protein